ncbi:MAG: ATP-binding protein [Bordetella sp.]|nr:MAG: ATP-binding protein [Bordetella sp.]
MNFNNFFSFFKRLNLVLTKIEFLISSPPVIDWNAKAFYWKNFGAQSSLVPIKNISSIEMDDLLYVDRQKEIINRNTKHFIENKPANNLLMTGARGTGKSSLVKAMLTKYYKFGLRIIEVNKYDLNYLIEIVDLISNREEYYIIFCDDLSFENNEKGYKELKSILDGSLLSLTNNILIYATSNRRHLLPEYIKENEKNFMEEIHVNEHIEEKISLSERFGLWLSFYPFTQENYLDIVKYWLIKMGYSIEQDNNWHEAALQWSLERGGRSGRIANQFARDWLYRHD